MHKKSKLAAVGVECEGLFKRGHSEHKNIYGDGSLEFSSGEDADYVDEYERDNCDLVGEIASEPYANLRSLSQWIRRSYPDRVNKTCSIHCHISTKTIEDYALLMHKKFWNFFSASMEKWGKENCTSRARDDVQFWARFNGRNSFCLKNHAPIQQLRHNIDKYTQLNYQSFIYHQTLECRLFPAFRNKEKAISGVAFFVRIVDVYLKNNAPNEWTAKYLAELKRHV
jgi:hypothetical protein